jgi:hypothetical protein
VHFLDAWRGLTALELARLVAPAAFVVLATLLPGPRVARMAGLGVAATIPFLREMAVGPILGAGWVALWGVIAWLAGRQDEASRDPLAPRGVFETGGIGLLLGLALLGLLVAAVARQDMGAEDARRASYGVLFTVLGLLHLMLRRHVRRSLVAFGSLGLGLQVLDGAARAAQVQPTAPTTAAVLVLTALAVALAWRIAIGRERYAGTAWVSDAHDLHD